MTTPVVFIIKNIKSFPHFILNDLIHMLKKYRAEKELSFCLILGVQNNNKDEIYLRINIQNCTKLSVKTFYFPSMKNIIFEVIDKLLLSFQSPLTFNYDVIINLIEQLNLFGMSITKFRRILRLLITEFVGESRYVLLLKNLNLKKCLPRNSSKEDKNELAQ